MLQDLQGVLVLFVEATKERTLDGSLPHLNDHL